MRQRVQVPECQHVVLESFRMGPTNMRLVSCCFNMTTRSGAWQLSTGSWELPLPPAPRVFDHRPCHASSGQGDALPRPLGIHQRRGCGRGRGAAAPVARPTLRGGGSPSLISGRRRDGAASPQLDAEPLARSSRDLWDGVSECGPRFFANERK